MKNRGQALILFILLLPLLLLILTIILNIGLTSIEIKKTDTKIKQIIEDSLNNDLEETKIKELIVTNLDNIISKEIIKQDNTLEITITRKIEVLYPSIINYNIENYEVTFKGIKEEKIKIIRK